MWSGTTRLCDSTNVSGFGALRSTSFTTSWSGAPMPPPSLADLQFEHFEPLRGEVFLAYVEESSPLSFELVDLRGTRWEGRRPQHLRSPFSMVFRGLLTPLLPQRMYDLEHAK